MAGTDDHAAHEEQRRRLMRAKGDQSPEKQAEAPAGLPDRAIDPIQRAKELDFHLKRLHERLHERPRALLDIERVRVARNLWDILDELEQRTPPIKKAAVLEEAGVAKKDSLDSTKHLPRYALRPQHEQDERRLKDLPKSHRRQREIAKAAAKLAEEGREDAYFLRLFAGTWWTTRGTETDIAPDALDRLKHLLDTIGRQVIQQSKFSEALRQVGRAPQLLTPRERTQEAPQTPKVFLGEFATSHVREIAGRFAWRRQRWASDLAAALPPHLRRFERRLNGWMSGLPPVEFRTQEVCQVWLDFGPHGLGGAPGMALILGKRLRLWTDAPDIPALVQVELEAVDPPKSYTFGVFWEVEAGDILFPGDPALPLWDKIGCTHINAQSHLRIWLSALWAGDGEWDGSGSDEARFASPNALPTDFGSLPPDPDVVDLFAAELVEENGKPIDLASGWNNEWEVRPLSTDVLGNLARPLPDYYLPFFELYGENGKLGNGDLRMQAARACGPAVATRIAPDDSACITTICDAAGKVPILEVAPDTMLAQLQRACLMEGHEDLKLRAAAEGAVREWTAAINTRVTEDTAEWRRRWDAEIASAANRDGTAGAHVKDAIVDDVQAPSPSPVTKAARQGGAQSKQRSP